MINAIAALDEERGIGRRGELLWRIPGEQKRFKTLTMGHPIILGRQTFETDTKRPLPGRTNIVITRNPGYSAEGIVVAHSVEEALQQAQAAPGADEIFVIGGQKVFSEMLPRVGRLYLTLVEGTYGADTFFPDYTQHFTEMSREQHQVEEFNFAYVTFERDADAQVT